MKITELNLSLPGRVFRSPMPFGYNDPEGEVFSEYKKYQVSWVVLLASDEECTKNTGLNLREFYNRSGLNVIHLPVDDFGVPDESGLRDAVERTVEILRDGHNIAVHCSAGIGRTGMFAACLAKRVLGLNSQQAIEWIRQLVPGSIETDEQERIVVDYEVKEVT